MQFVANKRWAKGLTLNATYTWVPRWTETGANDHDRHRRSVRRQRVAAREQRPVLLAPRAPHHRVGRVGAARSWPSRLRRHAARRLVDRPDVHLPVGPAVDHAGQRRPRGRSVGRGAERREGRAVHLRRRSRASASATPPPAATTCCSVVDGVRLHRAATSWSVKRSSAARRWSATTSSAGRRSGRSTSTSPRPRRSRTGCASSSASRPSTSSTARCTTSVEYNQTTTSADFGRINRNTTGQNNFQRFVQLGFRVTF